MNKLRILPPIAVLGIAFGICFLLFWTEPVPEKSPRRKAVTKVNVIPLKRVSYQVWLKTQGAVQARTEITLVSEVRGKVMTVSDSFRNGGFFEAGDVFLEIDPRDYETAVVVAEAVLAQAELALAEEEASAEQARLDWSRLQRNDEASDLVLRKPQLKQASANVASAGARLANEELNLERTRITAPFAGRILSKNVDVGQYVATGNVLARIYAVDFAEVRLPLNERQLGFVEIPEVYRGESSEPPAGAEVSLVSTLGADSYVWSGTVVRAEGALDSRSRQLFVIAQIDNPYGKQTDGRPPLKVGSFVQATIKGNLLEDVFVIPRKYFRKNEYVLAVDENDILRRRSIEVEWGDEENLAIRHGLEDGDRLCLTPLSFPVDGVTVAVIPREGDQVARKSDRLRGRVKNE
jgi:RND family efflux transporter MFP subunit